MEKFYQTIAILFEVLKTFTQTEDVEVSPEILAAGRDIKEKIEMLFPYNTLPLDPASGKAAIMSLPEIKVVVVALPNTRALQLLENNKKPELDLRQ